MNKKEEYIKTMLLNNIETATSSIEEMYAEVEEIRKLPNDCTGIMIDDVVCENPDYKIDLLTSHLHVIGYMESQRSLSQEILALNAMDNSDFEEYLIEQAEIEEHNRQEFEKLNSLLDKYSMDHDDEI